MGLVLYYDLLSQPCRAVYFFLKANNIDFDGKSISLVNGDHLKDDYKKIMHPAPPKVPILVDDGFVLTESVAMLRYIAVQKNVPEHWYPRQDAKMQARTDEFLNWHHMGLRKKCVEYFLTVFRSKVGVGRFTKIPLDPEKISELKKAVETSVKEIDENFLKGKPYIVGDDISAADLIAFNELLQMEGIGQAEIYESNKNVNAWMKRVAAKLGNALDEGKAVVDGLKDMYMKAK